MTRKHFQSIADAMKSCRPDIDTVKGKTAWVQWRNAVVALADMCAGDNHRFDRAKFYKACGMGE